MRKLLLVFLLLLVFIMLTACPTPFGIIYADRIYHWDGTDETIEDWLGGTDDEDTAEVTITIEWPEEEGD